MGIQDRVFHLLGKFIIERPGHKRTLAELTDELEASGQAALRQLRSADDSPENRAVLRHIVGIERWGQRRLQVALGEPPVSDESDRYHPSQDTEWEELQEAFETTRQRTVALAQELQEAGVDGEVKVPHNQWGALSPRGWLYYLSFHANKDVETIE